MEMDFLGDWWHVHDLKKKLEIMLYCKRKINIKNSVLDQIRYKHLNWYGHVRMKSSRNFGMVRLETGERDVFEIR
jgi:hypothetical protein